MWQRRYDSGKRGRLMKQFGLAVVFGLCMTALTLAQSAAPNLIGEWDLTTSSPVGESTNIVEFKKDGDTLKAFAKSPRGERPYDSMHLDGTTLTFVITVDYEGQPMVITYTGTIVDKSINGSADFGGLAMGSFSANRKEPAK